MLRLNVPAEFKAVGKEGEFWGYASIFGNVDLGGDVVMPGAFKEIALNEDKRITVLWQHHTDEPIGTAGVEEDQKGLRFDGQLVLEDPLAVKARGHMRAKSVRGASIGYDILPGGAEILDSGVRLLKALNLWEISIVTFGMNPMAGVESVKASQIQTIREFEDFLRDVGGFSASKAKLIASDGWKAIAGRRDVSDEDAEVREAIKGLIRGAEARAAAIKNIGV